MLSLLFMLLVLLGCEGNSSSPLVFEHGFVIESQADIEELARRGGSAYVIEGDLQIVGSDLVSLRGLEGLRRVEGSLEVWFNDGLKNLQGLRGLTSVGAGLGSAEIMPLTAAGKPAHVVEGLMIFENPALQSLAGLEGLLFVGGGLSIVSNESLISLADMQDLHRIDGSLDIWFNGALESLEGLQSLTQIRDFLEVSGNGVLATLDGLRGVRFVGADLIVSNNGLLAESAVRVFAEHLVAEGITGAVVVEGNSGE